jgi:hypothetical protein
VNVAKRHRVPLARVRERAGEREPVLAHGGSSAGAARLAMTG